MPDDFSIRAWVSPVWENEKRIPPCSEVLRFIRESGEEASHAPGEVFRYTDVGYCLLADLVEKLSGGTFEDYVKKNILEPAGMKDSGIYHARRDGRPSDRIARNMVLEEGGWVPSDAAKSAAPYVVGSDGMNGYGFGWRTVNDTEHGLTVGHSGCMPGLDTWFERFVDEDRVLAIFSCREYSDGGVFGSFREGMRAIFRGDEPSPAAAFEKIAAEDAEK